jgi:hypothetical protein
LSLESCVRDDSRPSDKAPVFDRLTNELVVKRKNLLWCTDQFGFWQEKLAYLISVLIISESETVLQTWREDIGMFLTYRLK